MNLFKSKLRRGTAVLAGAFLGLAGVVALAAPASAHHSVVSGTAKCDTTAGEWVVTWDIEAIAPDGVTNYRFEQFDVTPAGTTVTNVADNTPIAVTDTSPQTYPYTSITSTSTSPLIGEQRVAGAATEASLTVRSQWNNGFTEDSPKSATVQLDGTCTKDAPKPDAKMANTCAGVTVTLSNGADAKLDAVFTVKGENGFSKTVTVKAGQEGVTVDVPAKDAGSVVVTVKGSDRPVLEGKYEQPKDCQPEDNADRYYEATCDSLIFTIDNTKGEGTITATFTPNKGDAQTLTVKGGDKGSVTFKGEKGLKVTVTEADDSLTVDWDSEKPKDCGSSTPTAVPSTTPASNDGLPETGAAASSIAGGAAVLLAIGGVLFFLARRRKVKFTA